MKTDVKKKPYALYCKGESRTKQNFKDECDINNIVNQFLKTGLISHVNDRKPVFGDFSKVPDYQSVLDLVNVGRQAFEALPEEVRNYFHGSSEEFMNFMNDERNHDEAVRLGLIKGPEKPAPTAPGPTAPDPEPTAPVDPPGGSPGGSPAPASPAGGKKGK